MRILDMKVLFWTKIHRITYKLWCWAEEILIPYEKRLCEECKNKVCNDEEDERECYLANNW